MVKGTLFYIYFQPATAMRKSKWKWTLADKAFPSVMFNHIFDIWQNRLGQWHARMVVKDKIIWRTSEGNGYQSLRGARRAVEIAIEYANGKAGYATILHK